MAILDEVQARSVTIFGSFAAGTTILACYVIAVSLGHVPIWLPMISDCAVQAPEMYLFRVGLISAAVFLQLNSVLMVFFLNGEQFGKRRTSDMLAAYIAAVACFCLAIVGAVNERENGTIHSVAAVIFFFGYEFYMIMVTIRLAPYRGTSVSNISFYIKLGITIFCGVALTLFVFFSTSWHTYHIQIAVCEWSGVYSIIGYNLSFCYEYKNTMEIAFLDQPSKDEVPMYFVVPNHSF